MIPQKNICLVDDHVVVRHGLIELIQKIGPYKIVRQFDNGEEFLEAVPLKPEPDLTILDLNMPGLNGEDILSILKEKDIKCPILILTLNEDEDQIVRLFRLGARGYLKKNCSVSELTAAIEDITERGYYHNEFLTMSLQYNGQDSKKSDQEKILEQLTSREREFLRLVCHEKEYTYEQIADQMKVQHRTVDGYRESIFDKFGIKSKTGLVLFILKHKMFEFL